MPVCSPISILLTYCHTDITNWIHALEQRTPGTEVWTVTHHIHINPFEIKETIFLIAFALNVMLLILLPKEMLVD